MGDARLSLVRSIQSFRILFISLFQYYFHSICICTFLTSSVSLLRKEPCQIRSIIFNSRSLFHLVESYENFSFFFLFIFQSRFGQFPASISINHREIICINIPGLKFVVTWNAWLPYLFVRHYCDMKFSFFCCYVPSFAIEWTWPV